MDLEEEGVGGSNGEFGTYSVYRLERLILGRQLRRRVHRGRSGSRGDPGLRI